MFDIILQNLDFWNKKSRLLNNYAGRAEGKMHRLFFAFLIFVGLLGCAATTWNHPTKSRQDYYSDRLNCEQMANQLAYQAYPLPPASINVTAAGNSAHSSSQNGSGMDRLNRTLYKSQMFRECMYSKGWYNVK